jgi:hypothetical protein
VTFASQGDHQTIELLVVGQFEFSWFVTQSEKFKLTHYRTSEVAA